MRDQRKVASGILQGPDNWNFDLGSLSKEELVKKVRNALYASKIVSYAQGLDLIAKVGKEKNWGLNLGAIARIWRGGCIIRARFLNHITEAYETDANLTNLMLAPFFTKVLNSGQQDWREVVALAATNGIPVPSFGGSLSYYDAYRAERVPAPGGRLRRGRARLLLYSSRQIFMAGPLARFRHFSWERQAPAWQVLESLLDQRIYFFHRRVNGKEPSCGVRHCPL